MTKKKEAYVVLVGLKPGVYKKWLEASPHVTGVSENQHQGFETFAAADEFYKRAQRNGETRTVTKSPSQDEEPQDEGGRHEDRRGGQKEQSRREQDSCPAASVQTPTSTLKGSSAGKAARDAQIAAALAGARKGRIRPSASSPSVIPSETSQSDKPSRHGATLARSATEPAYHLQRQLQVSESESVRAPPCPSSARRTTEPPTLEPELEPVSCTPETKFASDSCGSVSDISTYKTQTKNQFTNSPGLATPRYAQSLSYASSPSSLASSDLRTHLSSPSSCGTQYFPKDWLARHGRRQESNDSERYADDRSVVSLSEYATAPNTPEQGSIELEDALEATRGVRSPSPSTHSRAGWSEHLNSSSSANSKARPKPKRRSSAISPPAAPKEAISSPQRHTHLCACEHPEYACINCGQRPRLEPPSARSAAGQSRSTRFPSTMTTTASPAPSELLSVSASSLRAPSGTPASAVPNSVRTRSSSSRSHGGEHTPVLGQREAHAHTRSQSARIQEALGTVSFAEAGRGIVGAEPVVHDVSFDPRSPIQTGTSIPAGTSGSAVRPSPAMAPVAMGSLGLLFPS